MAAFKEKEKPDSLLSIAAKAFLGVAAKSKHFPYRNLVFKNRSLLKKTKEAAEEGALPKPALQVIITEAGRALFGRLDPWSHFNLAAHKATRPWLDKLNNDDRAELRALLKWFDMFQPSRGSCTPQALRNEYGSMLEDVVGEEDDSLYNGVSDDSEDENADSPEEKEKRQEAEREVKALEDQVDVWSAKVKAEGAPCDWENAKDPTEAELELYRLENNLFQLKRKHIKYFPPRKWCECQALECTAPESCSIRRRDYRRRRRQALEESRERRSRD